MKPAFKSESDPTFMSKFGQPYTDCLCSLSTELCNETEILFQTLTRLSPANEVHAGLVF